MGSKGCLKYHIKGVFYLECHQYLKDQLRAKLCLGQGYNDFIQIKLFQDRNKVSKITQENVH